MSMSSKSPTSQVTQEPDVPTVPSPEPKRHRLNPVDDTIVYDEPFHVRARGNTQDWDWYPDMIKSWVCQEQVPPPHLAASTSSVQTLPPLQYPLEIEELTESLGMTDAVHENLVTAFHELQTRVNVLEFNLGVAETRIEELEGQLEAANAAGGVAQEDEPEEEPAEDDDAISF
ncbi:hypothetical protein L1987_01802 [Smallanthus sonchifolius]|uniref:Uncharacterized protein n=1 Tax=Smallanthus sonchifolius TaxID=185202 RepID=A0ACB9K682_9ASTR|nr:hypothetical protein L1987_01802 [Smallanthus sonchifolius]